MKTKLSDKPQQIDEHNWYYEERKGVVFVHRVNVGGKYLRTDMVTIPWAKLMVSVDRRRKSLAAMRLRAALAPQKGAR